MGMIRELTKEDLVKRIPRGVNIRINDEVVKLINSVENSDGILQEYINDNILNNLHVLKDIKVSFREYVNAVRFCTLKMNMPNEEAWSIVFKEKYDKLKANNQFISSHVSMYNKTKIVQKIDANMMVAIHVYYAPLHHEAIKKQYELMNGIGANESDYVDPKTQQLAAKTLAELTAIPEDKSYNVQIGLSDEARDSQAAMISQMKQVAENQRKLLEQGYSVTDIQKLNIKINEPDKEEYDYEDAELIENEEE